MMTLFPPLVACVLTPSCRHIVKHMSYDAARQLLATVGQDHVIKVRGGVMVMVMLVMVVIVILMVVMLVFMLVMMAMIVVQKWVSAAVLPTMVTYCLQVWNVKAVLEGAAMTGP